jgi:hypothetical protein
LDLITEQSAKSLKTLALPRGLEPCFRRERARFTYLIVLAALAPATARFASDIAGAQDEICIGPVLRIEERIAPDRDRRIGLGDLAELHPDVAVERIRAHVSESMRTPILSLGATSSSIACRIEGTPAITTTLAIQKPRRP